MVLNFRRGSAFATKQARNFLKNITPNDIKQVAVIRHAAIGDYMVIRPFLIELKTFFKNCKITLCVDSNATYGIPFDLVDEIFYMDKHHPKTHKKTNLIYRIKQAKTLPPQDIIFDLTDSSFTLLQIIFSKAKLKIGYPYRMIRRLFFDIAILRSDFVYEANSIMHMLNILGSKKIIIDDFGFSYQKNIQNQIIYFAGASTKDKCWEEEKFAQLISIMANKYPHIQHIILQGIKEDEKFLDIYNKNKHHTNVILQQPMDLNTTMQFLANSKIVISNDTGIRNMAIAVDTPTVGIFFATGAFRYWPQVKIHRCVFNENYVSPDVQDVYIEIKFLIDLLKDKS